jgi:hypothetical protein
MSNIAVSFEYFAGASALRGRTIPLSIAAAQSSSPFEARAITSQAIYKTVAHSPIMRKIMPPTL